MTVAKRAKRVVTRASDSEKLSPSERRAIKLRIEELRARLSSLIQEKPEKAIKAAAILSRWLGDR